MSLEFNILVGPEVVEMEQRMPADQRARWPTDSVVIYATEDGVPVGRMALMSLKVVEGSWVSDEKRGTSIAYRLMKMMEAFALRIGDTYLLAMNFEEQPEVGEYLKRVNFERLPVAMYSKELIRKKEAA